MMGDYKQAVHVEGRHEMDKSCDACAKQHMFKEADSSSTDELDRAMFDAHIHSR